MRRRWKLLPYFLVSAFSFVGGAAIVASIDSAGASTYRSLDIFAKVLAYVENSYVDETDSRTLIHGAIRGMLDTLDDYTVFLPAEEYRHMKADTAGEFGGLGLEVRKEDDRLVVVEPLEDSPASRAGILPGDWIVSIEDTPTAELTVGEAVKMMRGQPGTRLRIGLFREGFSKPLELVLLRDRIQIRSVEAKLYPGGIGYVRIKSFQEKTESFLTKALGELRQQNGQKDLSGLVLDLRGNPGGLLDQAVRVADRFLAQGEIVTTRGRGGKILDIETAHRAGTEPDYPMVILVDERSASASEVLAGALQDHGRAVVMGTTTFGKGSVQTVVDLDDGSGLKLTVARYYTPNHRSIHGTGIEPDVVVSKDGLNVVPALAVLGGDEAAAETDDAQLRVALRTLRAWEAFQIQRKAEVQTAQAK